MRSLCVITTSVAGMLQLVCAFTPQHERISDRCNAWYMLRSNVQERYSRVSAAHACAVDYSRVSAAHACAVDMLEAWRAW